MELKQLNNFSLPLELIFKIIHTNKDVPFIKYNPGSRREKLFRLYSEASTKTGKKIPVLRKALIFRLSRELAKNKSIGFYISNGSDKFGKRNNIYVELMENGTLVLKVSCESPCNIGYFDTILREKINPIMKEVQGYINQKGYNYLLHNTIQENSQIIKLDYQYSVPITKKVNIQKYNKCLSYIFNILEKDLKKGILMRYKRVSNYNYNDAVILL